MASDAKPLRGHMAIMPNRLAVDLCRARAPAGECSAAAEDRSGQQSTTTEPCVLSLLLSKEAVALTTYLPSTIWIEPPWMFAKR
jgi:hypothetical protein